MRIERRTLFKLAVAAAAAPRTLFAAQGVPAPAAVKPWRIQRLSWAGVRIEGPQASLFIDPVSAAIWDGPLPKPIVLPEASSTSRAVLLTHLHNDHFDPAGVRQAIGEKGVVICLDTMAPVVASRGFRVWPVPQYQPETWGGFIVIPVPAQDGFGVVQVSWIVIAGDHRLIHGGDTLWHSRFDLYGRAYGPFDYAFLPPNGVVVDDDAPPRNDLPRTMTPKQAVTAAQLLRARTLVPIHYGHSDNTYHEFPNALDELRKAAGAVGQDVQVVEEGGWVVG